ncbi:methionyl-tRNA formyltransferase [Paracoccus fistulariae]|uniref:Methionyl-tRNA formyltransferase n=1 Tax=Paracoccus fistulariae TaxID=658446 RepID=A0ABY7SKV3_9RHOB|nr:methionyl-tRNA formyltransferase [Paracoccus fistulariae]MDB6182121.1 methionyl-tRNA formyltransferase [Paracoccus fistulariae]WCR06652.1 methionyl-tRNA formyltransferase [Paracoccus fistulariae]
MRVVFMGTPEFSVPALRAIAEAHEVVAVYSQPPRQAGRGQKPRPSPVQRAAEELGIEVRVPARLRDARAQEDFAALQADVAVVVAYGLILPQAVLGAPRLGCLNIHASLLPRWRGAAPIHRAVMSGDAQTGVAIMQMEAGLDTGPVLAEARTEIGAEETTADLHDRLAGTGAGLIVDVLGRLPMAAVAQPAEGVTYAEKIDKAEARIDWARPAIEVDRLIRGLSPFPGAWCEVAGERVKLLRSRVVPGQGAPGDVLSGFRIACGDGAVEVTDAQRAGKKPMAAEDLLKGWTLPARLD